MGIDFKGILKGALGTAVPLLASAATGGVGGPIVQALISKKLGVPNTETDVANAMQSDDARIKLIELENENEIRLKELAFKEVELEIELKKTRAVEDSKKAIAEIEASTQRLADTQELMGKELKSDSIYKSGWRPLFGWIFAVCFGLTLITVIGGAAYAFYMADLEAGQSLAWTAVAMLAAGAPVLGINMKLRSDDKKVKAGVPTAGIFSTIFGGHQQPKAA